METFFSLLERHSQTQNTRLCVGLDPHLPDLPAPTAEAALEMCTRLVQATARYAAAFKPNAAFFEQFGAPGWQALHALIQAIQAESYRLGSRIPVIVDAKRGDIASTAEAYARALFTTLQADAVTLSPYLGGDSVEPFVRDREKGAFVLCKTSNPGSADLQDLILADGSPLYVHVARQAQTWNTNGNVGLVVGATHPAALAAVRAAAPEMWFLVPGVGAQGGDLAEVLHHGQRARGDGLLINVSRAIARAPNPAHAARDWREAMLPIQTHAR